MADAAADKQGGKTRERKSRDSLSGMDLADKIAIKSIIEEPMEQEVAEQSPDEQGEDDSSEVATCYCGGPRKLDTVELMCGSCGGWFHGRCTSAVSSLVKCLPFMVCYQFTCKNCNGTATDSFTKKQATFSQVCHQAMANLTFTAQQEGEDRPEFSKDMDIIPFIEKHWDSMTTMTRRTKQTWHKTVLNTMMKEPDLYIVSPEEGNDAYFTLVNQDLTKIGPVFDPKAGPSGLQNSGDSNTSVGKGRTKRRGAFDNLPVVTSKKSKNDQVGPKLPPHGYPLEHPFNKDGYRYYLAEADPHAPNRQAFDESTEMAGKPIPGYLYRVFQGTQVLLSMHDRAIQLKLSDDRLTVTGEKGYSMIRASHGVITGQWYYEVTVTEMAEPSAVRIGWSQPLGNLQAPCGFDKFSYSWRSKKGTVFHQSKGKHYCDRSYKQGDTVGFFISLPPPNDRSKWLPETFKDRPLVKFKSHLYFEEKDSVSETEKTLQPALGSKMVMYRNGKSPGVAFEDMFQGVYHPAISLYKNATVTVNFGPKFKYPPKDQDDYRPMSEAADQAMAEGALADVLYHIENEGKQPDFQ